jgi:hypothetical protein
MCAPRLHKMNFMSPVCAGLVIYLTDDANYVVEALHRVTGGLLGSHFTVTPAAQYASAGLAIQVLYRAN